MRLISLLLTLVLVPLASAQYGVQVQRDVTYTTASGYPQALDLYLPVPLTTTSRPVIMLVHGGGWTGGNKTDLDGWGNYYAGKGYVCASVSYRFAPQHVWPAQIDDVQASVRWIRKNKSWLFINPNRIGAVGFSAGGHLVQFLALTDTITNFDPSLSGFSSKVNVAVDFVGPTIFDNPNSWHPAIWPLVTQMVGVPWSPTAFKYRQASPMTYADSGDSPLVLFYGVVDDTVPIEQGRRMNARLTQLGLRHWYYEFPNEGHGFSGDTLWYCVGICDLVFQDILNRP